MIISLELLLHLGVKTITIKGNSQLVIRKLKGDYKCSSWALASYLTTAIQLIDSFDDIDITCVLRDKSQSTNDMAQLAFRINFLDSLDQWIVEIQRNTPPSVSTRGLLPKILVMEPDMDD